MPTRAMISRNSSSPASHSCCTSSPPAEVTSHHTSSYSCSTSSPPAGVTSYHTSSYRCCTSSPPAGVTSLSNVIIPLLYLITACRSDVVITRHHRTYSEYHPVTSLSHIVISCCASSLPVGVTSYHTSYSCYTYCHIANMC